ncbi:MAG: hypothetical protein WCB01_11730 [Candidatus Cybelea sp.]
MQLVEYAHGSQEPIKTLDVPNMSPSACAVDTITGNLAAVDFGGDGHEVDLYYPGSSYPRIFVDKKLYLDDLTYDSSGNLFVIGFAGSQVEVAELPKGTTKFEMRRGHIGLNATSGIKSDGKHLTIGQTLFQGGNELYRYVVRGNRLKHRRTVSLSGDFKALFDYWIQGSRVVATNIGGTQIYAPMYLFNYPGGNLIKTIGQGTVPAFYGSITISVARK